MSNSKDKLVSIPNLNDSVDPDKDERLVLYKHLNNALLDTDKALATVKKRAEQSLVLGSGAYIERSLHIWQGAVDITPSETVTPEASFAVNIDFSNINGYSIDAWAASQGTVERHPITSAKNGKLIICFVPQEEVDTDMSEIWTDEKKIIHIRLLYINVPADLYNWKEDYSRSREFTDLATAPTGTPWLNTFYFSIKDLEERKKYDAKDYGYFSKRWQNATSIIEHKMGDAVISAEGNSFRVFFKRSLTGYDRIKVLQVFWQGPLV